MSRKWNSLKNRKYEEKTVTRPQWKRRRGQKLLCRQFRPISQGREIDHAAFDSNNENSTLKRFHPEAGFLNLADPRGLDPMIQALEANRLVAVDCRAASTDVFLNFFSATDLTTLLVGMDAVLTLAMPVGAELDSIEQVQRVAGVSPNLSTVSRNSWKGGKSRRRIASQCS